LEAERGSVVCKVTGGDGDERGRASAVDAGGSGGGSTWAEEEWKETSVVYYQASPRRTPSSTRTLVISLCSP
jgi:hypothetical protein